MLEPAHRNPPVVPFVQAVALALGIIAIGVVFFVGVFTIVGWLA